MSCTARMGLESSTACVDSNFRVFGLQNIRVVDLSICPFVPNAHTQTFGEFHFARERLVEQTLKPSSLMGYYPSVKTP